MEIFLKKKLTSCLWWSKSVGSLFKTNFLFHFWTSKYHRNIWPYLRSEKHPVFIRLLEVFCIFLFFFLNFMYLFVLFLILVLHYTTNFFFSLFVKSSLINHIISTRKLQACDKISGLRVKHDNLRCTSLLFNSRYFILQFSYWFSYIKSFHLIL